MHGDDEEAGFRQGSPSACVFYHEQKNVRMVAHGDGITVLRSALARKKAKAKAKDPRRMLCLR